MALLAEILLFGVVPIAFALWQIRDVRREQAKRRQRGNPDDDREG